MKRVADAGGFLGRAERLLHDHGGHAGADAGDRLDANEARAERAGRDQERRGRLHALGRQIGHAAGPRERRSGRVVDRDAGAAGIVGRQRRRGKIEEVADAGLVAHGGRPDDGVGGDAPGNRPEHRRARVEPAAELGLNPRERRLVGRAEARALERVAGCTGHDRGCDAGAHDAQNERHVQSQDTRVL